MYNLINSLIARIKPVTAEYSADALSRLIDLERIADDYESYNEFNTRYSAMSEIDTITDSFIGDVENDFYTAEDVYNQSTADMVINTIYDIYSAFEQWTDEMSENSHSVKFWNV